MIEKHGSKLRDRGGRTTCRRGEDKTFDAGAPGQYRNGEGPAAVLGRDLDWITGVASRARVIAYKVCGEPGCFGSGSVAAVEQAIRDGADVLNVSIHGFSLDASEYTNGVLDLRLGLQIRRARNTVGRGERTSDFWGIDDGGGCAPVGGAATVRGRSPKERALDPQGDGRGVLVGRMAPGASRPLRPRGCAAFRRTRVHVRARPRRPGSGLHVEHPRHPRARDRPGVDDGNHGSSSIVLSKPRLSCTPVRATVP
ncbi:S8 family serine peptidase [Thiocapsa marina]|uniref:S8 family serine peptidase n=1 Tax=Thiocapsa marina TaxID=244573 RepID=UPI0038992B52